MLAHEAPIHFAEVNLQPPDSNKSTVSIPDLETLPANCAIEVAEFGMIACVQGEDYPVLPDRRVLTEPLEIQLRKG